MNVQSDIRFSVNRIENGITGFTLMGVGKTEAESFCLSFLTAQAKGKGEVTFENGKIFFKHDGITFEEADTRYSIWGISDGGVFSADVTQEEEVELSQILNMSGKYSGMRIRVKPELAFGKGFTVYVEC